MSDTGDHVPEMSLAPPLDDGTIDAIFDGDRVPHGLDHLAAFAAGVVAAGDRPAPRPSPELAALLRVPQAAEAGRPTRVISLQARRRSARGRAAGLGLAARVGVVTTAVAASVVGAAAAGVLPGGADSAVRRAIEVVTRVEFSDDGDRPDDRRNAGLGTRDGDTSDVTGLPGGAESPSLPGEHGDRVSSDATGEADGEPGVDGPTVAEQAPGAAHQPQEPPGQSGATTPAAGVPATPGGPADTASATAPGVSPPSTTAGAPTERPQAEADALSPAE